MLVGAVTRVDYRTPNPAAVCEHVGCTGCVVPNHDGISTDCLKSLSGVFEAFTLAYARPFCSKVDHVGRKTFGGHLEADSRSGRVFEEKIHNSFTAESG